MQTEKKIDLKVPTGWNQCTTDQLELIAAAVLRHTILQDRYHPFDWQAVKAELFFAFARLEIIEVSTGSDVGSTTYIVKLEGKHHTAFPLQLWQVYSFIDQHLKWLDDPKAQPLLVFPYKQLIYHYRWQRRWPFVGKAYLAPEELLQNYSWEEYRHLQDYIELYVRQQNQMVQLLSRNEDAATLTNLQSQVTDTRNQFLAILFCGNRPHTAAIQRQIQKMDDIQWQVILFWWSGFMHYLQKKFPRCFKKGNSKSKSQSNPLDLYISITATMQKYLSLDEEKVNRQTFYLTLEQVERIARENEELEKMKNK